MVLYVNPRKWMPAKCPAGSSKPGGATFPGSPAWGTDLEAALVEIDAVLRG